VTLYDKKNGTAENGKPGCLMRKSRLPIDLTTIGRIELDIQTTADEGAFGAPWYSVWLAPMIGNSVRQVQKDAEIDLIENIDGGSAWNPVNQLSTQFSDCGHSYVPGSEPYCSNAMWDPSVNSYAVDHHITLKVHMENKERRIEVCHCAGTGRKTCDENQGCANIWVDKGARQYDPPTAFPVWQDSAQAWKGHYWLVSDIWKTQNRFNFRLNVDNVTFWDNDDVEWEMPLDGPPPTKEWDKNPSDPTQYENSTDDEDSTDDSTDDFLV